MSGRFAAIPCLAKSFVFINHFWLCANVQCCQPVLYTEHVLYLQNNYRTIQNNYRTICMYFLWFCIYRTITEPLAGSTECGEPQPTTVKVVTALMLENAKTNKKRAVFGHFRKSPWIKFIKYYLKLTSLQYYIRFSCYHNWKTYFWTVLFGIIQNPLELVWYYHHPFFQ